MRVISLVARPVCSSLARSQLPLPLIPALLVLACLGLAACPGEGDPGDGGSGVNDGDPIDPDGGPGGALLVVSRQGSGGGTVRSTPVGIDCGVTCEARFPERSRVALSAAANADSTFVGWSGACSGTGPCEVTVDGSASASARFDLLPGRIRLEVIRQGPGGGSVVSDPPGIDCGGTCAAGFVAGTQVTLRVHGAPGLYLAGWSGACTGPGVCSVKLQQPTTVTALLSPRICPSQNMCWDSPLPHGGPLNSVYGFAPDNVVAVGSGGILLRYNGVGWVNTASGTPTNLNAVWGAGDKDFWVGGDSGLLRHYDGATWTNGDSRTTTWNQTSLIGFGARDIWSGGDRGWLVHYDGTAWTQSPMRTLGVLHVWGAASDEVWAVGAGGVILRYSGTTRAWTTATSGTTNGLFSVWGSGKNDVWAVGQAGTVRRWNGTAWNTASAGTTDDLVTVYGTAANDVWAAATSGALLRYNGTAWQAASSGVKAQLNSMWGRPGDVWAVGTSGALTHFDGTRFTAAYPVGSTEDIRALWGASQDDIWLVGARGSVAHYDGMVWRPVASGTTKDLRAVWGSGPGDVWMAGETGTVLHWDGTTVRAVSGAAALGDLRGLGGTAPDDVWVAGDKGLAHWDGAALKRYDLTFDFEMTHIFATGKNEIWAGEGLLVHIVGATKTFRNTGQVVAGIWGKSGSDFYVGLADGTVSHFDGTDWGASVRMGPTDTARFFGLSDRDVWSLSDTGQLARFDGTSSKIVPSGIINPLSAVWGTDPTATWIAGGGGTVLRLRP